jgi:hypothetical protein
VPVEAGMNTVELVLVAKATVGFISGVLIFSLLGYAAIKLAPTGWRSLVYTFVSNALALAATAAAFLTDLPGNGFDLSVVGISPTTILAIGFGAKAADGVVQWILRQLTTAPVGMAEHPAVAVASALQTVITEQGTPQLVAQARAAIIDAKATGSA